MFQRILLPVEDSDVSRRAATIALGLAKDCHARLLALHVVLPERAESFVPGHRTEDPARDNTAEYCIDQIKTRASEAGVPCDGCIMHGGEAWDAIHEAAREKHCDLIVMGSHGRRGLTRFLLGSETQAVLTHSDIPVLVCP